MSAELVFGPQTREFSTILSASGNLDPGQVLLLESFGQEKDRAAARRRAMDEAFEFEELPTAMTMAQFLLMAAEFGPSAVVDAALAAGTRHLVGYGYTRDDHDLLLAPWTSLNALRSTESSSPS